MRPEYQHTNRLQQSILLNLRPDGHGLVVVGDDDQAIYRFRAATVANILEFPARFQPPARVVCLQRNYRSTRQILAASNSVISLASMRYGKELRSDRCLGDKPHLIRVPDTLEQARYVAEKVIENRAHGASLESQVVLYRNGGHSSELELELGRRQIPYVKVGGIRFLDRTHIRDVLAILRLATQPRDHVAAMRVLQLMPGVGPKVARKLIDDLRETSSLLLSLSHIPPLSDAAFIAPSLVDLMRRLVTDPISWPAELRVVRRWYESIFEWKHLRSSDQKADLDRLERLAATFPTRRQFLAGLALDPLQAEWADEAAFQPAGDSLTLSTIHSAKGLEWTHVFILNVVDGGIPADFAIGTSGEMEEERRLLYVAMTRAIDRLHLLVPQHSTEEGLRIGKGHATMAPTSFIPPAILSHFSQISWPGRPARGRSRSPGRT